MKQHYPSGAENCREIRGRVEKVTQPRFPHRTSFLEGKVSGGVRHKRQKEFSDKKIKKVAGVLHKSPNNLWLIGLIDPETGRT